MLIFCAIRDHIQLQALCTCTSAVMIIEIDTEIAILHGDRNGSRSVLFDFCRFSLCDSQQMM